MRTWRFILLIGLGACTAKVSGKPTETHDDASGDVDVDGDSSGPGDTDGDADVTDTDLPESTAWQIGGCDIFPASDAWNQDISGATVSTDWTTKLHTLVGNIHLHPDFGNYVDPPDEEHYGIPINVVPEDATLRSVEFDYWPEQSDPSPYPFPAPGSAHIEGGIPTDCDGDCHMLVVQSGTCQLYEAWLCRYDGGWICANGAKWDLTHVGYGQREEGFTSADAAGLPILAGLARYSEVVAGEIRHALRFTVECSAPHYVAPATHYAVPGDCDEDDPNAPPMGLRVRLRDDFNETGFSDTAKVFLAAMKKYGMILADNGGNFFFQSEYDLRWTDAIDELKDVPVSAFEVVTPGPLGP